MQSYEQRVAIDQAVRDQQTACMAGFGFEFRPPPTGTTPPPNPNDANMERRYGITDRVVAERHGYGLAKEEPPAGSSSPKLGEAATMVLSGAVDKGDTKSSAPISYKGKEIPQGGCSGWAPRKVGAAGLDFSLVSRLNYESLTRSQETPKVRAALKSWSRCMKEKGYEVAIPFDAIHLTTGKGTGARKPWPSRSPTSTARSRPISCRSGTGSTPVSSVSRSSSVEPVWRRAASRTRPPSGPRSGCCEADPPP